MGVMGLRKVVTLITSVAVVGVGMPLSVDAGVIGTAEYISAQDRDVRLDRIYAALMEDRISKQLTAWGVDPADARQRVAALTDEELVALDERIQELPAGAGALEVVLIIFLVVLFLDLAGLSDVFPGIGPGKTR